MTVKISVEAVSKQFKPGQRPALKDVTLALPEGSLNVLIGTSGSGKTTLMRMINRLIEPTSGKILIDGRDIQREDVIQLRRNIGYVIQHIGLFPHMTIGENVSVPATLSGKWNKRQQKERVEELLETVGLPPREYYRRYPRELSGGQQQRVGIARALMTDPDILLMDEPFGALDAITRSHLQKQLQDLQRSFKKTIVFVSHDLDEALLLGDQIVVLDQGELLQAAPPVEILTRPAHAQVSRLFGGGQLRKRLLHLPVTTVFAAEKCQPGTNSKCLPASSTVLDVFYRFSVEDIQEFQLVEGEGDESIGIIEREAFLAFMKQVQVLDEEVVQL